MYRNIMHEQQILEDIRARRATKLPKWPVSHSEMVSGIEAENLHLPTATTLSDNKSSKLSPVRLLWHFHSSFRRKGHQAKRTTDLHISLHRCACINDQKPYSKFLEVLRGHGIWGANITSHTQLYSLFSCPSTPTKKRGKKKWRIWSWNVSRTLSEKGVN